MGIPIAIVVGTASAWAIDGAIHSGQVMRNMVIDGRAIGGLAEAELRTLLQDEVAPAHRDAPVELRAPGRTLSTTAGEIGLSLDVEATVAAALDVGRDAGIGANFVDWVEAVAEPQEARLHFAVDLDVLRSFLATTPNATRREPVEPSFEAVNGRLTVTPGESGQRIRADFDLARLVEAAAAAQQRPIVVEVEWSEAHPLFDQEDIDSALAAARELTDQEIYVKLNQGAVAIAPETIRRWVVSDDSSGFLEPVFEEGRVRDSLEAHLGILASDPVAPSFAVVEGSRVAMTLGDPAMVCCEGEVAELMYAVASGEAEGPVQLEPRMAQPDGGRSEAEALGVTTLVGEFTTNHSCCQSRVVNIHRMADLVRGALILPGETFSINGFVGKRTVENGFVAAGAIEQGHLVSDVGGGVSQFATTMFNAAFFAGLDFTDYQSHSIYFSRYPRGREATLGHPAPDLAVTNNTPYAMLIWTDYTDTSITVQLWSTRHFEVEETGQSVSRWGPRCTRVDTFRTRTAPDGQILEDSVFAIYRPGEGLDCFGNRIPKPRR